MLVRQKAIRVALALGLLVPGAALGACDSEDRADVQEGVDEIEKGVEEGEEFVDENVDKDGKDD